MSTTLDAHTAALPLGPPPPTPVPQTGAAGHPVPIAPPNRRRDMALRAADLTIAGTVLVITLPLTATVAAVGRLVDGGPVLYRGPRLGRGGEPFTMYKFRTLRAGAEERLAGLYGPALQEAARAESTRLGRVLRPAQLDELPQLVNVVRGEMSMVGPRPLRPQFYAALSDRVPNVWQRFAVRPGVTGLAQLRQDNVTPWEQKLAHDLEYVADRSLGLYARCCGRTAARVATQSARTLLSGLRRRPPERA
jgi:lipopolysaccharide/colanic/teichoic acid biosynthesis glycosyltransferase